MFGVSDIAAQRFEQVTFIRVERVSSVGVDVQHAEGSPLVDQWNRSARKKVPFECLLSPGIKRRRLVDVLDDFKASTVESTTSWPTPRVAVVGRDLDRGEVSLLGSCRGPCDDRSCLRIRLTDPSEQIGLGAGN